MDDDQTPPSPTTAPIGCKPAGGLTEKQLQETEAWLKRMCEGMRRMATDEKYREEIARKARGGKDYK